MGGGWNYKRLRLLRHKYRTLSERKENIEKGEIKEISKDEIICKNCGFKTRYKFLRCPECNEVQK